MPQSWRTVRVFISSTFRDMHAERDHLVRIVFPELKERCRQRHVQLIDVDLRWGVTQEQAEGGGALDICLDEIDSCRPYFLGLVGHRYGYIPPGHKHSITAQEVYHGVLHNNLPRQLIDLRPFVEGILEGRTLLKEQVSCLTRCYQWNADKRKYLLRNDITPDDANIIRMIFDAYSIYQRDRSFFFFRSESLTTKLAGSNIAAFFEADKDNSDKLAALKNDIAKAGLIYFPYDDIEGFGRMVIDTLWARIAAEFPEKREEKERDWLKEEAEPHDLFMTDRTRRFVGRSDILKGMHSSVDKDDDPRLLVVTGEPGCGKSALMARFAEQAIHKHPDWLVISHFVGASPSSTSLRLTLRRFCTLMYRSCDFEMQKGQLLKLVEGNDEEARKQRNAIEKDFSIPEDPEGLKTTFERFLNKASASHKVAIIIDAVNQFDRTDNAHSMNWLPQSLSQNVKVVVSTLPGEALDALLARRPKPDIVKVEGLKQDEIKQLVTDYLGEIHHEFPTSAIRDAFYEKIKAGHPLYIIVALEELKIFPKFEELGERIKTLPGSVPELFDQVLKRVEGDLGQPVVKDFMCYLACGRHGMTAEELQTLLKGHTPVIDPANPPDRYPDMLFARLRRAFSAYLFERSGVIDFFHGQLKEAVVVRYLKGEASRDKVHRIIADYFEKRWREPYVRALDELPHQLTKAKDWDGMERILCDLFFIEAKCANGMTYDLVTDYNIALDSLPEAQGERQKELERERRIEKYTHDLIAYAKGEISTLNIISSVRPQTDEEIEADSQRIINNPTHLDRIRAFSHFVNLESYALLKFAAQPGFCIQHAHNFARFGPVALAAESGIDAYTNHALLLHLPSRRYEYNPHPALLRTLEGHTSTVQSVALTPDGRIAISGSWDRTLRVWDLKRGECLRTLVGHTDNVESVAISADGRRAVSGSADKTLRVWDLESGKCLRIIKGHTAAVQSVALTPDARRAISGGGDGSQRVWDLETANCLGVLRGHIGRGDSVAITADGRTAISAGAEQKLMMWSLKLGECVRSIQGHASLVNSVTVTPDGRTSVSGSYDKTVRAWDLESGGCVRMLQGHTDWVESVAVSADGRKAVSGSSDTTLREWDLESGGCLRTREGHTDSVWHVAFTHDGRITVSGSKDGTLRLWSPETGECLRVLQGHTHKIYDVILAPQGRRGVSASADETLRVWDFQTGECLGTLRGHTHRVGSAAITPDCSKVVSASLDRTLRVWDLESGKCLRILKGHTSWVNTVAITLDGRRAVSASDDETMRVWDLDTGRCLRTLKGHTGPVTSVVLTPDSRAAVSASLDETLRVWDLETNDCLRTLEGRIGVPSVVFLTQGGRRVVSAAEDAILAVWNLETGKRLGIIRGRTSRARVVALTPDGRMAISASDDNTLRVENLGTGQCLAVYHGRAAVTAAEMNTHGVLALGTAQGEVILLTCFGLRVYPPVVTPVLMWLHSGHKHSLGIRLPQSVTGNGRWDDSITATCLWCGGRFSVAKDLLDIIKDINHDAHLSPDQSPCLELPNEAWDEPKLLSECPLCHKPLKFNPFIVANRGRY